MSKHHPDLIMCRRQPGIGTFSSYYTPWVTFANRLFFHNTAIARLCEKCDGKCPICDSYVRPETLVRICDECNFGSFGGRCTICGGQGKLRFDYLHRSGPDD
ncbi:hypothetical protein Clacol_007606 [Clathrus columnatus]|uniref:Uncharacterized protein n=1 Tax=Clathrus columnatus TaxID=1419009 RepID=A0AAV5AJQ0_9AGAM|nr:hypothetical protein Clacol_007606 [Clathrus columnatus]